MLKGKLVTGSELLGKLSGVIGANPTLITKNITANGTYTASSDNADGYSEVDVDVQPTLITKNITANGTYMASSDNADGYSEVDIDVQPTLITKNITANGTYTASSDNADGYSEVDVDVQPNLIEGNFTENGEYVPVNADGYSKAIVNVPSSGGIPASDNGNLVYFDPSNLPETCVSYMKFSLNGVHWIYNSSSSFITPCFATPKPSGTFSATASCFLEGYTSKRNFFDYPNNDKCVFIGGSNINISDLSFNGDINAFAQYMNDKYIYVARTNSIILNS